MKRITILAFLALCLVGCSGGGGGTSRAVSGPPPAAPAALSPNAVILDNNQAGTWFAGGGWNVGTTGADKYGADYVYSATAGATYNFNFEGTGKFEVYAWWTAASSRSTVVPISVQHAAGTATSIVNQRLNGGAWNLLGTFDFNGSLTKVTITVPTPSNGLYGVADAVAWNPVGISPPPPPTGEIVIDNGETGTAKQGTWSNSGAPNPYGTNSLYNQKAGSWYSWTRALTEPGAYDAYVWWTANATREQAAQYDVATASGVVTLVKNQRQDGGKWNLLGTYQFSSALKITVRVPHNVSVCADAVRFVASAGPPPPPPPDPPPAAPAGLLATAGDARVDLDWGNNAEPDLASYSIYRATGGGSFTRIKANQAASAYADIAVTNGTAYTFYVTAVDAAGHESAPSAQVVSTPQGPPPPPPPDTFTATLAWDPPTADCDGNPLSGLKDYLIEWGTSPGVHGTGSQVVTQSTAVVPGLAAGNWYFVVHARDAAGNDCGPSQEVVVTWP